MENDSHVRKVEFFMDKFKGDTWNFQNWQFRGGHQSMTAGQMCMRWQGVVTRGSLSHGTSRGHYETVMPISSEWSMIFGTSTLKLTE